MPQTNSDPLPYTQVDRAVKPKAAMLAGTLGVTVQHALGSLVEFWDLCGDPRDIEALMAAGKQEIILTALEVVSRFALASGGKTVDPALLLTLGLLEARGGDKYRVRGMSRYFAPIRRRVQAREAAKAGGLASVASRKLAHGTAQPRSALGSTSAQAVAQPARKRRRSAPEAVPEANAEATLEAPPNTAVSVQRSTPLEALRASPPERRRVVSDLFCAAYLALTGHPYSFDASKDGKALTSLLARCPDDAEIERRARIGIVGQYAKEAPSIFKLDLKWNELVSAHGPPPAKPPDVTRGMVRAQDMDHSTRPVGVVNDF